MRVLRLSVSRVSVFLVVGAAVLCSTAFAAVADRISGPIDSSRTIALAKSLHPKAQPRYDQGPVERSFKLGYMTMLLAPSASQQQALNLLLAQQQDRTSPNYHKWLTPQQFGERFGLSQNDLAKITAWLTSEGFQILRTGAGRNAVIFSGDAAQVQSAFGTEIHRYNVDGRQQFANATPVMLPAALNGIVSSVMGLHSFLPHPAHQWRTSHRAQNYHPDYYDSELGNLLAPNDVATIYDIAPLYSASTPIDGAGQKLAIVGQTDVYLADIADFRSGFGLNPITGCATDASGLITSCSSTYFQYVLVGSDPGAVSACGDLGEADLDIEWSGATARAAQIVYVNSPVTYDSDCNYVSGGGVNAALTDVIDPTAGTAPLASVVSMSYGACEAEAGTLETVLQQGNVEGVTIFNSAGDDGAAACDYSPPNNAVDPPFSAAVGGLTVSYPASSPEVTGVGGTEISLANEDSSTYWAGSNGSDGGSALSYIPEIPWNDDAAFADFCESNSGNTFCTQGGSTRQTGWVAITSAATAQEDIWISAGGGGASNCFTQNATTGVCEAGFSQPTWQKVTVSGAPAGVRYVPDVSLMASPNFPGYIFCTPQSEVGNSNSSTSTCVNGIQTAVETYESIVGGTSASTPIFAGIVTLLNQYVGSSGLGNINPTLYQLAASSPNAFHKITSGDNDVYCQAGQPTGQPTAIVCPQTGVFGFSASNSDSATGYNLVNGLGSVDANELAVAWLATAAPDFTLTASTLTPSSVPAGGSTTATLTIAPISGSTGMVVNFSSSSCTGLPTGATCSFSPASVTFNGTTSATTTLTISTLPSMAPSGPTTITIAPTNSGNVTATVSLTVTATTQSFTLAPSSNATIAVTAGQSGTASIMMTPHGGFNTPLIYTCTDTVSESTCIMSPAIATTMNPVTLSVATAAPSAKLVRPGHHSSGIFYAALLPGLFGIFLCSGVGKSGGRGMRLLGLIVVLGASTLWLGSCGGTSSSSSSNPGTPAGTYTITVNATTGGANPLTNSTKVTLTVTQ